MFPIQVWVAGRECRKTMSRLKEEDQGGAADNLQGAASWLRGESYCCSRLLTRLTSRDFLRAAVFL